jgi:hypothetical protein
VRFAFIPGFTFITDVSIMEKCATDEEAREAVNWLKENGYVRMHNQCGWALPLHPSVSSQAPLDGETK